LLRCQPASPLRSRGCCRAELAPLPTCLTASFGGLQPSKLGSTTACAPVRLCACAPVRVCACAPVRVRRDDAVTDCRRALPLRSRGCCRAELAPLPSCLAASIGAVQPSKLGSTMACALVRPCACARVRVRRDDAVTDCRRALPLRSRSCCRAKLAPLPSCLAASIGAVQPSKLGSTTACAPVRLCARARVRVCACACATGRCRYRLPSCLAASIARLLWSGACSAAVVPCRFDRAAVVERSLLRCRCALPLRSGRGSRASSALQGGRGRPGATDR